MHGNYFLYIEINLGQQKIVVVVVECWIPAYCDTCCSKLIAMYRKCL